MKYRLKDRELQKKLDALSAINRFSYCLQEEAWKKERFDGFNYIRVDFGQLSMLDDGETPTHSIYILKADIEEYEEYNPKKWNKFPDVEPPEGVWMRVEWRDGAAVRRDVARYVAWGDTNEFVWMNRGVICDVERFRPWLNDDEIEAERKAEYKKDMHPDAIATRRYMSEEDE